MSGRHRVEVSVVSAAPPDVVWTVLADASTWSVWGQWDETTLDREGVPAPDGVGALRRFRRGRRTTVEEVVAFEPPVSRSGTEPVSRSGTEPVSRSGTEPVSRSGTESVSRSGTESVSRSGTEPVSRSGTEPARFAYELRSGLPLRDYHAEVTLEPVGGGTRIRWVSTFDGAYPVVGTLMQAVLGRFIPATARRLAAAAEAG
jgi:Polyketide cyclase / dehydrase and lipid transport